MAGGATQNAQPPFSG